MRRAEIILSIAVASVTSPSRAGAATTKECISAFDEGQQARREGALRRAREALLVCSQQECPSIVRADCADVLRQVDAAQPTLVLKAADRRGADLADVVVELGEQRLATTLDGRAIPVDPGTLSLVFRRPPWEPVTVQIVIGEGEKGRIVQATMGPAPAPRAAGRPEAVIAEGRGLAGYLVPVTLAVAGAGALTFAGLTRLSLGNEADDLRASCAPECSRADRDRMSGDLVLTNVALGIGLGSLALAAATWFLLGPRPRPARLSAAPRAALVW